jgi:hypothetical protein
MKKKCRLVTKCASEFAKAKSVQQSVNITMIYLYGLKAGVDRKLVATFDSEPLLLSYVRWATLKSDPNGTKKFEQGSPLVGFTGYE